MTNKDTMPFDEQGTAYLNIKIWLERALMQCAAGEHDHVHANIEKVLHHLPIIKPDTDTLKPQLSAPEPQVIGQTVKANRVLKRLSQGIHDLYEAGKDCWEVEDYKYMLGIIQAAQRTAALEAENKKLKSLTTPSNAVDDAEVREAVAEAQFCINEITRHTSTPDKDNAIWSVGTSSKPRITARTLKTLIRAAESASKTGEK